MNATTATLIKFDNSLEVLNQFGIEIDLESILAVEFELGLSSDISNAF
jgi:hypothetical protein